jgi:murein L,D-transpeptidase YcbB/YkuD
MRVLRVIGIAASAGAFAVALPTTQAGAQFYYPYRSPFWQHVPPGYGYEQQGPYGYHRYPEREPRVQPERKPVVVPRVRVKSPSYYTYSPDRLKNVSFEKLAEVEIASQGEIDNEPFVRSKSSLAALSLRILPEIGEAIVAHYLLQPRFIWIGAGGVNDKAAQALATFSGAAALGLNPADYYVKRPEPGAADHAEEALARFEIELSAAALLYVLDANRGRIDPNRISGYHHLPRKNVDLAAALASLTETSDVRDYLLRQHPDNVPFRALTAELARLRSVRPAASIKIGKSIRPGETSEQLPQIVEILRKNSSAELRRRHAEVLKAYKGGRRYDQSLVALIRDFQREQGVGADGVIRQSTFPASKPAANEPQIRKIELALERLRWLPRDLGQQHVLVNQPAFTASYVADGKSVLSMRAVIGKSETQTYFFSDQIEYVEYNPNWNVPHSILVNQMLPKLARDPRFLAREGYEVINASGKRVSAASVDWARVAARQISVTVRQRPSDDNALGSLKIMFPNDHAIYMHDTPQKSLFSKPSRAFSNGCIRLENAVAMAAAVLGKGIGQIEARIASGNTSSEKVTSDIPVHVAYFTAWPEHGGRISYFDDVYGRDDHLAKALAATDEQRRSN